MGNNFSPRVGRLPLTIRLPNLKTLRRIRSRRIEVAIENGQVDLVPSRFQKIAELISSGQIPLDMAIVQIAPPNEAGYCSLGVAVDVAWEAMERAAITVGEINLKIPRTFGDTQVHVSRVDAFVEHDQEVPTLPSPAPSAPDTELCKALDAYAKLRG